MSTEEEARKRLIEASEKKQSEHLRKIYEEAGSESALSEHKTLLDQQGHLLPPPDNASLSSEEYASYFWNSISQQKLPDSGGDSLFSAMGSYGQLKSKKKKSKKKNSKKKHSKKKLSKKKHSKKKRSKKRRSRKY